MLRISAERRCQAVPFSHPRWPQNIQGWASGQGGEGRASLRTSRAIPPRPSPGRRGYTLRQINRGRVEFRLIPSPNPPAEGRRQGPPGARESLRLRTRGHPGQGSPWNMRTSPWLLIIICEQTKRHVVRSRNFHSNGITCPNKVQNSIQYQQRKHMPLNVSLPLSAASFGSGIQWSCLPDPPKAPWLAPAALALV